jgi:hypothetical protein
MKFSRANAPKARPLIFIHNNLAQIGYCQRSHDRFRPNEPHIWGRALDTLLICSACTVYASCFFQLLQACIYTDGGRISWSTKKSFFASSSFAYWRILIGFCFGSLVIFFFSVSLCYFLCCFLFVSFAVYLLFFFACSFFSLFGGPLTFWCRHTEVNVY